MVLAFVPVHIHYLGVVGTQCRICTPWCSFHARKTLALREMAVVLGCCYKIAHHRNNYRIGLAPLGCSTTRSYTDGGDYDQYRPFGNGDDVVERAGLAGIVTAPNQNT